MATVELKPEARTGKWGLVRTAARDFTISGQEVVDINNSKNQFPSAITREEWEKGGAVLAAKSWEVGDYVEENGVLAIKYAEFIENGRIMESVVIFGKGEWSGDTRTGVITVDESVLRTTTQRSKFKVDSIRDGVITYSQVTSGRRI